MRYPCVSTTVGFRRDRPITGAGDRRTAMTGTSAMSGLRWIAGRIVRLILVLFIALEIRTWLDVFVLQPEEYERLIGGESGCGKFQAFCSWSAFVLDQIPFTILSALSVVALLWRRLPRRELTLGLLAVAILAYLAWRMYWTQVEASLSEYCCQDGGSIRVTMQLTLTGYS